MRPAFCVQAPTIENLPSSGYNPPCRVIPTRLTTSKKRGDFGSLMGRASNFNGFAKTSEVYAPKY